jgi:hypothetical protein
MVMLRLQQEPISKSLCAVMLSGEAAKPLCSETLRRAQGDTAQGFGNDFRYGRGSCLRKSDAPSG